MNIRELLSELRENILNDRSDRVAGQSDRLWSDAALIRYINEAQHKLCREGLVLRDGSTDEVTLVTLQDGVQQYVLHESIITVMSARLEGERTDMRRIGHEALYMNLPPHDWLSWDTVNAYGSRSGKPVAFLTDEELRAGSGGSLSRPTMTVYPTPDADYDGKTIRLRVVRLPLQDMTKCKHEDSPEVSPEFHMSLLDWAAHLALRILDVDAGNAAASARHKEAFAEVVFRARQHAMRQMYAPTGWRFGLNGFSWSK